ncbi:MAG: phosphate ABC transporter permease subunit PstC [Bacteroidales bacterium]|nr:phosphate ABC transporter permease subunit PstC [Bacteroidales bacterium]
MFVVLLLPFALFIGLAFKSELLFRDHGLGQLLFSSSWRPSAGEFGFKPFIVGSLYVTLLAMIISAPICLLSAIHITQYAPARVSKVVTTAIDILAGIPSVVYGVWGMMFVVPIVSRYAAPLFGVQTTGFSILSGGVVLSIMVVPFILNILIEIYRTIPKELTEAALSLGATRWEAVRSILNRKALPGILAAVGFGFARAFGETMAVLMVVGNAIRIPESLFDQGYPLPALIANSYSELASVPEVESALMFAALILFVVVLLFNATLRWFIIKTEKY